MSPESRNQMVSGMVDRLVDKLRENPKNLEGWLMLARSRMVLGDTNAARTAIDKAREIFAGDAAAQSRIAAYMKDIGLNP
jgi:cytochrome c-type biogenesis protein CcmH